MKSMLLAGAMTPAVIGHTNAGWFESYPYSKPGPERSAAILTIVASCTEATGKNGGFAKATSLFTSQVRYICNCRAQQIVGMITDKDMKEGTTPSRDKELKTKSGELDDERFQQMMTEDRQGN